MIVGEIERNLVVAGGTCTRSVQDQANKHPSFDGGVHIWGEFIPSWELLEIKGRQGED